MVFQRDDGQPFAFIPGQFIQVHFTYADGTPTKRSYSVGTVAHGGSAPIEQIEIAVSFVEDGAGTALLAGLQVGETVSVSGPYGRFCLQPADANQRYILVATGTGVTPYRAMLPQMTRLMHERGCRFDLVYGARTEADLLYGEEFESFAEAHAGFSFQACFSRETRMPARAHDRAGRVHGSLVALGPDVRTDIVYLCGNPDMVDQAFGLLKEAGLGMAQIRREKYISAR